MVEEPVLRWLTVLIIYAWGFHLGRAIYNEKMKRPVRWQMSLMSVSMFVLFSPNLIEVATRTRFILIGVSFAVLLISIVPVARKQTDPST